jgi:hypothetical protein
MFRRALVWTIVLVLIFMLVATLLLDPATAADLGTR